MKLDIATTALLSQLAAQSLTNPSARPQNQRHRSAHDSLQNLYTIYPKHEQTLYKTSRAVSQKVAKP